MRTEHDAKDCLPDIIDNADRIATYIEAMGRTAFTDNRMVRDAVDRCIERICEASHRLGHRALEMMPDEPWADIPGMGNRLRHGDDRLDLRVIWAAASERVPSLATSARDVLAKLDEDAGGNRTG